MTLLRTAALASVLALLAGAATGIAGSPSQSQGAWAERVQVVYHDDTRSVLRKQVKVWDAEPRKNLDFVWEPAKGEVDSAVSADGVVNGRGKLVWRVRGSASYDPKTIYSVYAGELRDGRPHGRGRLEIRSGEVFEGDWNRGVLEGQGVHVAADGSRYEGSFKDGTPEGTGRLLSRTGEIFEGPFRGGLRHGVGRTTLTGGTTYESEWAYGTELGSARPDVLADASVGGLLKAQAGGGDAGKVGISTVVDQRMTQQADMQYQHLVRDEDIAIYPVSQEINDAWNGTNLINVSSYMYEGIDWENAPAFVEIGVATDDGSRVKLDRLELQVTGSDAYRKPMLTLQHHTGCVGFRPSFSLVNHGWGAVQNASITMQFSGEEPDGPASRSFTRTLDTFDNGADVVIGDVLREAGVNTDKLESGRFQCQSVDSLNVCRSQVFNSVGFGEIADFVWGDSKLFTTARGKIDYSWSDDNGNTYQASEPFQADISLATIEVPLGLAECGDGFGGSPEALRYQDVKLQVGQRDYVVDMPVRGNKNISEYYARLKMSAEMSSFHQFQTVAKFTDGSERRSKTVSLFYFNPRPVNFESTVPTPACYLPPELEGC